MSIWKQYIDYVVRRYRIVNVVSFLLILLTLILLTLLTLPERKRLNFSRLQDASMQKSLTLRQVAEVNEAPTVMTKSFYKMLPNEADFINQLEKLFDTAAENNIYLDDIEYKFDSENAAALSRYVINLPVEGTYTNIRKFIKQLLEQAPNAALDNIVLSREDVTDDNLKARLKLTFYIRKNR